MSEIDSGVTAAAWPGLVRDPLASGEPARLERPCIRVWNESVWADRGQGLSPELREQRVPVLSLAFQYQGFRVTAREQSERVFCATAGGMVSLRRDLVAERRARILLESFGAIELDLLEDFATAPDCRADYLLQPDAGEQAHCAFFAHALPQLRAHGFEVEVDEGYPYRVIAAPAWYAQLEPDDGKPDWFGLELGVDIAGHRIDLLPVLLEMLDGAGKRWDSRGLTARAPRYVRVPDQDCYVEVPAQRFELLSRVVSELYQGEQGSGATFPGVRAGALAELERAFAGAEPLLRVTGRAADTLRARARATAVSPEAQTPVAEAPPPGLLADLRPYQAQGVGWLRRLAASGAGAVLADDMGLGKTLQAIAFLCAERATSKTRNEATPSKPSLLVVPTSLVGNWRRELQRFAPSLRVLVLFGSDRLRRRSELPGVDVVLTSYSVLLRDADWLCEQPFQTLILDEAQAIKNARSRTADLARALRCEHRIVLTGTPMENNLGELWSLLDFAVPGLLGSQEQFRHFYRIPIEQERDEQRLQTLRAQVAPYVLRRLKEHVATELPPKTELVRPVELLGKQRELYESIRVAVHDKVRSALRKQGLARSTVTILAALTRLRQLCCDPRLLAIEPARFVRESAKYELLMSLLSEQRARGRRVLVFSQFATMLGLIACGLREQGVSFATLTGATTDRDRPVRAFQEGEIDVFLISLKAGGTGLNLTRADTVIHYDPWWNPAAQDQATDRAHRIGQDNPVFVYSLIAAGSVEERMLALQQRKRLLASAVISGASEAGPILGEAEVEHLLAPLHDA